MRYVAAMKKFFWLLACVGALALARGAELFPIEQQVVTLWAMQKGYYDAIDQKKVNGAAVALREFFATRKDALLTKIRNKAALDAEIEAELKTAVDEWKATYAA